MRTSNVRVPLAFFLSTLLTLASVSAALAVWTGQTNGVDLNVNGWIGADNPDNDTGSYSVDNIRQDSELWEWDEPSHDKFRNMWNRWGAAAETKLDNEAAQKALDVEFRIHENDFYNFTGVWNTTLPWSGIDPDAWFEEPFCVGSPCTEVDVEVQDPSRIEQGIDYWAEIQIDAERNPTATRPDFVSEIEYCDNDFASHCHQDATAWFRKKLVVR